MRMFDVFFSLIKNQSRNNILKFIFAKAIQVASASRF